MKKLIIMGLVGVFLISSCGPEPEPTMSPADVQGTAIAAAWTMVAETQAAIPTETPIPPTETPLPSPTPTSTPLESPTPIATATLASSSSGDECDRVMASNPDGPHTIIAIKNESGAPITITIGLLKTVFGECGYRSYNISKNATSPQPFPQGCYWAYVWVNDPKSPTTVSGGGWCANNSDKWTMKVTRDIVRLVPP